MMPLNGQLAQMRAAQADRRLAQRRTELRIGPHLVRTPAGQDIGQPRHGRRLPQGRDLAGAVLVAGCLGILARALRAAVKCPGVSAYNSSATSRAAQGTHENGGPTSAAIRRRATPPLSDVSVLAKITRQHRAAAHALMRVCC